MLNLQTLFVITKKYKGMSSSGRHHLIEMLKGKELVIIAMLSVIAISLFVLFYTLDVSAVKSNLAPDNTKSSNDNQKTIMRSNCGKNAHKECPDKRSYIARLHKESIS
jgi:hypothetical protein